MPTVPTATTWVAAVPCTLTKRQRDIIRGQKGHLYGRAQTSYRAGNEVKNRLDTGRSVLIGRYLVLEEDKLMQDRVKSSTGSLRSHSYHVADNVV